MNGGRKQRTMLGFQKRLHIRHGIMFVGLQHNKQKIYTNQPSHPIALMGVKAKSQHFHANQQTIAFFSSPNSQVMSCYIKLWVVVPWWRPTWAISKDQSLRFHCRQSISHWKAFDPRCKWTSHLRRKRKCNKSIRAEEDHLLDWLIDWSSKH